MNDRLAPYQVFFPLGILYALVAVGVWILPASGGLAVPAILLHPRLIAGGFLWCFISGFLMTAVPRMTGTESARIWEYVAALALLLSQGLGFWSIDGRNSYIADMLLIAFLVAYAGRRLRRSRRKVPVFFSHVGLGMALGIAGAYAYLRGNSLLGIHLYHVGAVLLLVLGIGTRFFSFLSGLPSAFEDGSPARARGLFHGLGILAALLLWLAGTGLRSAYLGLFFVTLIYLFFVWKVQRRSARPSALKYGVRGVALMIPLSFLGAWFDPANFIAWFHLLFIGCFSLLTFSVATRVTLAHGSYPVDLETKSRGLWVFLTFLALALVARFSYAFLNGEYRELALRLAVVFWICAVISWCYSFLSKIWKPGPEAKAAC
jgi:uncharacterized protein involved in response to NO